MNLRLFSQAAGLAFVVAASNAAAAAASDQNWPQWRGPSATGVSPAANPPTTWTETNNVKWKTKIPGYGTSTPIIWGNQVFIQTAISSAKPEPKALPPEEQGQPPGERRPRRGGGGGGGR